MAKVKKVSALASDLMVDDRLFLREQSSEFRRALGSTAYDIGRVVSVTPGSDTVLLRLELYFYASNPAEEILVTVPASAGVLFVKRDKETTSALQKAVEPAVELGGCFFFYSWPLLFVILFWVILGVVLYLLAYGELPW